MAKFTITRALAELKLLKSRYLTELNSSSLVAVRQGQKLRQPNSSLTADVFETKAAAQYQSIEALRNRIIRLKEEIDKSNSTTVVQIGGKEMTVQQAIVRKNFIDLQEAELRTLKMQYLKAQKEKDLAEAENKARVERLVSEATSAKTGTIDTHAIEKDSLDAVEKLYETVFVDPIKISEKIEALEKEIEDFRTNVDYVLSESNSTTFVEIED